MDLSKSLNFEGFVRYLKNYTSTYLTQMYFVGQVKVFFFYILQSNKILNVQYVERVLPKFKINHYKTNEEPAFQA